jgi:hypothetical protein
MYYLEEKNPSKKLWCAIEIKKKKKTGQVARRSKKGGNFQAPTPK